MAKLPHILHVDTNAFRRLSSGQDPALEIDLIGKRRSWHPKGIVLTASENATWG